MIKEIEVGGVKHSITLADDMVGSGLTRSGSGAVCLNLPIMPVGDKLVTGLVLESGQLCIQKYTLSSSIARSGLAVDELGNLFVDMPKFAGSGLLFMNGKLMVSGKDLGTDAGLISGIARGLLAGSDFTYLLSSGMAGFLAWTGLKVESGRLSFDSSIIGSGLYFDTKRERIHVTVGKGVTVDESLFDKPLCVNIAKRDTGLRLFFNSKGELDVTQD